MTFTEFLEFHRNAGLEELVLNQFTLDLGFGLTVEQARELAGGGEVFESVFRHRRVWPSTNPGDVVRFLRVRL